MGTVGRPHDPQRASVPHVFPAGAVRYVALLAETNSELSNCLFHLLSSLQRVSKNQFHFIFLAVE